jgi:hypothetical protein
MHPIADYEEINMPETNPLLDDLRKQIQDKRIIAIVGCRF